MRPLDGEGRAVAFGTLRAPPNRARSDLRQGNRPPGPRAHDCVRGKGIASPDQPREPKQSWRPQGTTGLDVRDHDRAPSLLNPDSEQAGSRSCVGRDRTDGRREVAAARLGRSGHFIAAAISAAPFRPQAALVGQTVGASWRSRSRRRTRQAAGSLTGEGVLPASPDRRVFAFG